MLRWLPPGKTARVREAHPASRARHCLMDWPKRTIEATTPRTFIFPRTVAGIRGKAVRISLLGWISGAKPGCGRSCSPCCFPSPDTPGKKVNPRPRSPTTSLESVSPWGNTLKKNTWMPNSWVGRSKMIAVRSGAEGLGQCHTEVRDYLRDYRAIIGEDPPPADYIAIMIDGDGTKSTGVSYFADIEFCSHPPSEIGPDSLRPPTKSAE
jgi:hypothetical protein